MGRGLDPAGAALQLRDDPHGVSVGILDIPLMADANSAYTLDDIPLFERLDDLNLMMIEQPLGEDDIA